MEDPLIALMRRDGIPVTRQNYIDMAYAGIELPDPWPAELEAELPAELQDWSQFERPKLPPGRRRKTVRYSAESAHAFAEVGPHHTGQAGRLSTTFLLSRSSLAGDDQAHLIDFAHLFR
jgi:hypothetical protein